jgi:hypothetical protein
VFTLLPRITIFTGRFGSGKTEVALNYALRLADRGGIPLLVDLDVVTPYFRTREKSEEMAERGVEVVAPFQVGQYVDIPAISPRILGAIEQKRRPVVLDVGGDVQGARVLSQYAAVIDRSGYTMNFVVNPYRPFMGTVAGVETAVREIERSSHLSASHLVSNPNLMSESTPELVLAGHRQVQEASRALGLPISMLIVSESLFKEANDQLVFELPILVVHRFWRHFL